MAPRKLNIAAAQCHTLDTTVGTLELLSRVVHAASLKGVDLILFPEAFLGGYPRTCSFGAAVGGRDARGREQFLAYFQQAVDLGDTPRGAGDQWVDKRYVASFEPGFDGTRKTLEDRSDEEADPG